MNIEERSKMQEYSAQIGAFTKIFEISHVMGGKLPNLSTHTMANIALHAQSFTDDPTIFEKLADGFDTTPDNIRKIYEAINTVKGALDEIVRPFEVRQEPDYIEVELEGYTEVEL